MFTRCLYCIEGHGGRRFVILIDFGSFDAPDLIFLFYLTRCPTSSFFLNAVEFNFDGGMTWAYVFFGRRLFPTYDDFLVLLCELHFYL